MSHRGRRAKALMADRGGARKEGENYDGRERSTHFNFRILNFVFITEFLTLV